VPPAFRGWLASNATELKMIALIGGGVLLLAWLMRFDLVSH
jgi:hypothetical protein